MKNLELEYLPGDIVWFMYNNKITYAPIEIIEISRSKRVTYKFWWEHLEPKISRAVFDKSIHSDNQFTMSPGKFFPTKEALINSL